MTSINAPFRLAAIVLVAMLTPALARADEPDFTVWFPAKGLIDLNEGTIEYWIKFGFDPQERHEGWQGRASVFWLDLGEKAFPDDGWSGTIGTRSNPETAKSGDAMAAMTRFAMTLEGKKFPHPAFIQFPSTKADEWHHVAIIWSGGRSAQGFVDGKPCEPIQYLESFIRRLSDTARLGIGPDPRSKYIADRNPIAIDDLRISAVARKPEELGFNGTLKPDRQTLLLLDANHGDGKLVPTHSATQPGPTPVLPAKWKYIEGKFGRGLSLDIDLFSVPTTSRQQSSMRAPYLKGISTSDFAEALACLGHDGSGLSPATIVRMKEIWQGEYENFCRRDLLPKQITVTPQVISAEAAPQQPEHSRRERNSSAGLGHR